MTMELAKKMSTDSGLYAMLDALDNQLHNLIDDVTAEPSPLDKLHQGYETLESRPLIQPKIAGRRSAYDTGRGE